MRGGWEGGVGNARGDGTAHTKARARTTTLSTPPPIAILLITPPTFKSRWITFIAWQCSTTATIVRMSAAASRSV